MQQYYDPYGAAQQYAPQAYAADPGGAMAGQYQPYGVDPQFAPQGFFGNLIGKAAPTIGGMIGGRFGNAGLGQQIGGIASGLSRFIPFDAGPQGFAPQGYADGGMAGQYQPYGVDPQFAPQGFFGNLIGKAAPAIGGLIGGRFGNAGVGRQIGGLASGLSRFIPFDAGPQGFAPQGYADAGAGMAEQYQPYGVDPQFAPQGFFGNLIGKAAPTIGGMIGGRFGNAGLGQQIGGIASGLSRFIPFDAGPQGFAPQGYADGGMAGQYQPYGVDPQFAPQGFFGNLIGKAAPTIGGLIGGRFGNAGVGRQIGGLASGLSRFIPFDAGPQGFAPQGYADAGAGMAEQYQPYGVDPQFAPQGFFGNLISKALPIAGSIWGGPVGGIAGQGAGALARRYIPFGADPMMMQEWA